MQHARLITLTIHIVVHELKNTPPKMRLEEIQNITGYPINQGNFQTLKSEYLVSPLMSLQSYTYFAGLTVVVSVKFCHSVNLVNSVVTSTNIIDKKDVTRKCNTTSIIGQLSDFCICKLCQRTRKCNPT